MLNIDINKFKSINKNIVDYCIAQKIKKVIIELPDKQKGELNILKITKRICNFLDNEYLFEIWLKNFPYCFFEENVHDHILPAKIKKGRQKTKACRKCKYIKICPGFPLGFIKKSGKNFIKPIFNIPVEIMIEVESRCNFKCNFCFNEISFAKHGRAIKPLSTDLIKKTIDNICLFGVKIVRFTGGEPLLRPDIFELCKYAKAKKLEVRLNTNGSLITKTNVKQIVKYVDNILLPIESASNVEEEKITNYKNSLAIKIKAINLLKKNKMKVIRIGTVATESNINNFNKLAKKIISLPIDEWEFYRPICQSKNKLKEIKNKSIEKLIDCILSLRSKTDVLISFASALPLCSVKKTNGLNSVYTGAIFDEGQSRMVIDPRGFIKPHYFINKKIGKAPNIIEAWNNGYMEKIRNLFFIPSECRSCRFKFKCRGGSRYNAQLATNKFNGLDPLADPNNIK